MSHCYMTESTSGKDEGNPAFWLATQATKMGSSCPLRISCVGPTSKRSFFGHYNESLLTKLVRSTWLNVDIILFCIYIDLNKNAKKNFADIQPSWPHAWSITHMSSNLNSFRGYLLTFERLCDTCSLHYFKFFFLCLSYFAFLMLFMHFTSHQLFIHIALCRIFSYPWWCSWSAKAGIIYIFNYSSYRSHSNNILLNAHCLEIIYLQSFPE